MVKLSVRHCVYRAMCIILQQLTTVCTITLHGYNSSEYFCALSSNLGRQEVSDYRLLLITCCSNYTEITDLPHCVVLDICIVKRNKNDLYSFPMFDMGRVQFCQAQTQLQLSWTELALFFISPTHPTLGKYRILK